MADRLVDQFKQRYNRAMQISYLWASLHEACYFYAIPNRNRFWRPKEQQGEAKGTRVYDTTAIEATKTFVSKLHTAMTPPQTQWGFLTIDPEFDEDDAGISRDDAQRLLNDYMRKLFDYIHDSNFDVIINECYFDLSVGTSCLVINQYTDEQPLLFTSIPMDKLAIEEAMTGKIESWYRNWEDVKANEITVRWSKAVLPQELIREIKNNPDYTIKKVYEGVMYNPQRDKKYQYVVCSDNDIFYTEDFEVNPGIVWRFQKTNADTYGRGPVMDALPSIISLNELARIELAAANLNTFKPYMAFNDATFNPNTFKLQPMTIIPIAPLGSSGQPPLIPLPDTSNPQFSQLTIQDLRMQIRSLLFADSLIPTDTKQPVSATQIMIQNQTLAERIGPLFSRLQQEFLWPVIERCSYILDKMGLLPYPQIDRKMISFVYRSPLALAKGQEQIARFTQFFQLLQGISGPEAAQIFINPMEYPYLLADLMQIDNRLLNAPAEVAQVMQDQQNKRNEQQMMMEQQAQQAPLPQV
jgi:hypothetical protein